MIVKVIKEYKKGVTIHKVGDELGVTKELAKYLINAGLVEDVNDVLKLKKAVKKTASKPKKKSNASKTTKKA